MDLSLNFLKRFYRKIPKKARRRYSAILGEMFDWCGKNLNPLCPRLLIFKGTSKNSGAPLTFAYAGQNASAQEYWVQSVFAPGYQKNLAGRFFFWNILPLLAAHPADCHFVALEDNWLTRKFLSRNPGFQIPHWVDMEIDISGSFREIFGKVREDIERRIRKHQLTYEITRDIRYFDHFYYHMYLPYTHGRHSNTAVIASYEAVLKMFTRGEMILIKKNQEILCAGVFECSEDNVKFRKLGVTDGDWKHVRSGAIGACYYFIVKEMKQRGYTKVGVGGTRPLLNDGVTKFKMSLNARPSGIPAGSGVRLMCLRNSPGLQDFFINNPLIHICENHVKRAVFVHSQEQQTSNKLKPCNGIAETQLFVFDGTSTWNNDLQTLSKNNCAITSADALFLQRSKEPYEYPYHVRLLERGPNSHGKSCQMRT